MKFLDPNEIKKNLINIFEEERRAAQREISAAYKKKQAIDLSHHMLYHREPGKWIKIKKDQKFKIDSLYFLVNDNGAIGLGRWKNYGEYDGWEMLHGTINFRFTHYCKLKVKV
jgi:hypothetical protein